MSPAFTFSPRVFALRPEELLPVETEFDGDGHHLLARALAAFGVERRPILLDSAAGWPRDFSLLAFDPLGEPAPNQFESLRRFSEQLTLSATGEEVPGPFHGGFLGALAYDLGVSGEKQLLPEEPWGFPKIVGGLYTDFLVFTSDDSQLWLVLGEAPGDDRPSVEDRRAALLKSIRAAQPCSKAGVRASGALKRHTSRVEHKRRIEELRSRISRGEFYQANLAHRFTRRVKGDPVQVYLRLRESNPSPYAGFAYWQDKGGQVGALCSTSPELLLEINEQGGQRQARTRPIKGTAPRSADSAEDRILADGLLASQKDRAELAMIVDLERNDLGRTSKTGSVIVEDFPALRSYERVHHLMADVLSEPRDECDAWQILGAVFPGGSVTGAPKLASMGAISELESEGRGFFCGSLGFIDTRGQARFNLLIRTALWRPRADATSQAGDPREGEVSIRVGGGITWSSNAADEDDETLAKAAAMLDALEGQIVRVRSSELWRPERSGSVSMEESP